MRKFPISILIFGLVGATSAFAAGTPDIKDLGHALHFTVCEPSMEALFSKLGLHLSTGDAHQVSYFDSSSKDSLNCGLTVRLTEASKVFRSNARLKLNDLSAIDPALFSNPDFKCEFDQYAATSTLDCSLDMAVQPTELLTVDQLRFITAASKCSPNGPATLQYGPVSQTQWMGLAFTLNGRTISLDAERLTLPSGEPLLELTTRTTNIDAPSVDAELLTDFKARGISLCPLQRSHSNSILENVSPHPRAF